MMLLPNLAVFNKHSVNVCMLLLRLIHYYCSLDFIINPVDGSVEAQIEAGKRKAEMECFMKMAGKWILKDGTEAKAISGTAFTAE